MLPGQPADRGALDSSIVEGLERDVTDVEVTPEDVDGGAPHPRGDGAPDATDEDEPEADRSGAREPA